MIYLVYGEQYPIIKKRVNKIVNQCFNGEIDEFSYVKINGREVTVQDIVSECEFIPLGSDRKVIYVYNAYFLGSIKEKVAIESDQDYERLEKFLKAYFASSTNMVDIIFSLESKSINKKSSIYKLIEKEEKQAKILFEEGLTKETLSLNGIAYFQKKGVKITQEALDLLLSKIGDDCSTFIQESEKLCLYKKEIDVNDVHLLVPTPLEQNAFLMIDNLINNRINSAIKIYRDLLVLKEEPIKLINLLATQFTTYSQICYLYKNMKLSQEEIANKLSIHPYRVKLACRNFVRLSYDNLLNILNYLQKLDNDIKTMKVDPYIGFELFLINFENIKR
ncbi:MAG: DNA polymerase III subunit delta [Bacilli bacterium]